MTDPYTPTTEEVRDVHHTCPHCGTRGVIRTEAWLAQHDAELRKEIAWEIRAMGSESWDGYTPDEVPGTVATRIATQDASLDEGESR